MFCVPQKPVLYGAKHFIVCVDQYRDGEFSGSVFCELTNQTSPFSGAMPLLSMIDTVLDNESTVQKNEDRRTLRKVTSTADDWRNAISCGGGKKATFYLSILFRQNATWQGRLTWVEGKAELCFRSALEMLLAMHGAMDNRKEQDMPAALG